MHHTNIPQWAVERGRLMNFFPRIDPVRTALVVIDMQRAFTVPGAVFGNPNACDIIGNINRLAAAMRGAGGLVVWTRHTITSTSPLAPPDWHYDGADPFMSRAMAALSEGADGHSLHADLDVEPDDAVIDKYRYSALIPGSSAIRTTLDASGIQTLIIVGTLTNICVESTARDGYMMGYRILIGADATATVTDEEHNAALLNLSIGFADVRPTDDLLGLIAGARQSL